MRVKASPEAVSLVAERGGRLFVWMRTARCCRGVTTLEASTVPSPERQFRRVTSDDFELYFPTELERMPEELVVEVHGRRRRIEAYWDGCAWVT